MRKTVIVLRPLMIIALVIGCIGCGTSPAPVAPAHESALQTDLDLVKAALDAYVIQSGTVPTEDGKLPPTGEYATIDFYASFSQNGNTLSLYPDFIIKLPRHYDEGVWLIDSEMQVSVDLAPDAY